MSHQVDERGDPLTRTHDSDRKQFAAAETRQGLLGMPVLRVLGISLLLALVVWGAVAIWGERTDPTEPATSSGTSSTTSETETPVGEDTIDDSAPAGSTTQTVPTDRDPTPESSTGGDSQQTTPDGTSP